MTAALDVFISYANTDREEAVRLARALEAAGRDVWWDRTILPGQVFDKVIGEALRRAKCVVVLWSETSVDSDWVKEEAAAALERGVLVPALIDEVSPPLGFGRIQAASLVGWRGQEKHDGFDQLRDAIEALVAGELGRVKFATDPKKATELERAARLEALYGQAEEARAARDWVEAIRLLSLVAGEDPSYRRVRPLLEAAQKWMESEALHDAARDAFEAEDWQRVIDRFDEQRLLGSNFAVDPDGLEVAARERTHEADRGQTPQAQKPGSGLIDRVRARLAEGRLWQIALVVLGLGLGGVLFYVFFFSSETEVTVLGTEVTVLGTREWTDTEIDVAVGDLVSIKAMGLVAHNTGGNPVGPNGAEDQEDLHKYNVEELSDANHSALIGRIGEEGSPFVVGVALMWDATGQGRLYLGINDTGVENNSGEFEVTIQVMEG